MAVKKTPTRPRKRRALASDSVPARKGTKLLRDTEAPWVPVTQAEQAIAKLAAYRHCAVSKEGDEYVLLDTKIPGTEFVRSDALRVLAYRLLEMADEPTGTDAEIDSYRRGSDRW